MARQVTTFLMFEAKAEEAMSLYASLFPGSEVHSLERYGPGEMGAEGSLKLAELTLAGYRLRFFDSPVKHGFTFTPSISLFVDCDDEAEFDRVYGALAEGGVVMMAPANYGFSAKFAWICDRFGVSWQFNVP